MWSLMADKQSLFEWLAEQNLHIAFGNIDEDHPDFQWLDADDVADIEADWKLYQRTIIVQEALPYVGMTHLKAFVGGVQDGLGK